MEENTGRVPVAFHTMERDHPSLAGLGLPPLVPQGVPLLHAAAQPSPRLPPERAEHYAAFCQQLPRHTRTEFELAYG